MNSIWSEKEGCCVQFITCKGCHRRGKPGQLIGAEIVCVENPSHGFQKGQVRPKNLYRFYFIFAKWNNSYFNWNSESAREPVHLFFNYFFGAHTRLLFSYQMNFVQKVFNSFIRTA